MAQLYSNNGQSTLSASSTSTDTTLFIQPGHGARFPVISGADFFYVTLENAAGNLEVCKVTSHSSSATSMVVQRGQQGTTARAWASGDLIELRATSAEMTAFETDIDNLELTRALRAGDTHTGTHLFTGTANFTGTVTAPTLSYGSTGNRLATVDYVAAAAFSSALPGQAGNSGKILTTDGTNASWINPPSGLPSQASNAGKYLSTDGSSAAWQTIPTGLPSQGGNSGKFLTTDGTNASWITYTPPAPPSWLKYSQDVKRSGSASTATTTIDLQAGDEATFFKITISANTTITFTNFPAAPSGEVFSFTLMTVNDATAGRALAFGNTIRWSGGILPPRTTSANGVDVWTFFYENNVLFGSLSMIDVK